MIFFLNNLLGSKTILWSFVLDQAWTDEFHTFSSDLFYVKFRWWYYHYYHFNFFIINCLNQILKYEQSWKYSEFNSYSRGIQPKICW